MMDPISRIIQDVYRPALERQLEGLTVIGSLYDRVKDPRPIYTCIQKPMDVGELIRKLSMIDPNAIVTVLDGEHYDIEIARRLTVHGGESYFDGAAYVVVQT